MELLIEMRTYLADGGLVRVPRVAGSEPPLWLEPREGVPAPGQTEGIKPVEVGTDMTLGAHIPDSIPPGPYNSFQRQDIVEFWIRSKGAPMARAFERDLRIALNDKRAWQMAGMQVIESELHRGMQLLTADSMAYTYTLQYWFQTYA